MACEYKILLEKVGYLLGSNISLNQRSGSPVSTLCTACTHESQTLDFLLAGLKDQVVKIWDAYRTYPIKLDYSDRYVRAAYMLSYFPYYIYPIYHILNENNIIKNNQQKLNIGFLGGGALPELVGLSKYIALKKKNITNITALVFDVIAHWSTEREIITQPLIENYYKGNYTIKSIQTNLWAEDFDISHLVKQLDVMILQNAINETVREERPILKNNLTHIWNKLPNNAIFIIIDLNYQAIYDFIKNFSESINYKKVLINLNKKLFESMLPHCIFIQEKLFDSKEKGLYPRKGARKYWNIVLKKLN